MRYQWLQNPCVKANRIEMMQENKHTLKQRFNPHREKILLLHFESCFSTKWSLFFFAIKAKL